MLERKHKGVLTLNLKKLASRFDDLKIILIFQNEMLLMMLFCKHVFKQREGILYKFTCGRCYYGETCCHFKVRVGEPLRYFTFNEQTVQIKKINSR